MAALTVHHRGATAVITLTNPPANAMDAPGLHELADTVEALGRDADVTGIVITGEGRSFSAGLDLKAIQAVGLDGQEAIIEGLNRAFLAVYGCPRPTLAAVNGHCIAGGLVLALCCDRRLVADVPLKASLAEVKVGVVYPVGAAEVVRNELDPTARRRLILGGDVVDPHEAVALGVFDAVVAADDLLDTATAALAHPHPLGKYALIKAQLRHAALDATAAALDGNDPVPRPWLDDETFAAAAAVLAR